MKIYATDVDDEALAQARQGSYTSAQLADVPEELRAKYFEPAGERYVFRPDLRRALIFGRHDLVQDAAISRLDLLVCRNTLMYFNAETQAKILARFHFALNRQGYLFLGKAETLLSHGNNFRPEDLKARIFQRTPSANLRERLLAIAPTVSPGPGSHGGGRPVRVREAAFDAGPVAQIAVDRKGHLVLANDRARRLFNLNAADLGRLLQDLEISYRPVELRSHIEAATTSRVSVILRNVEWRPVGGEPRVLEILILPLLDAGGALLGSGISFLDQTLQHQLHTDLERAHQELETAYEELQSSNEELETTNEELQSTIEELETTNEELQSANEELETMNEELQSTNEELRNINDQFQVRSEELRHVNSHLHSILGSLRAAVVVLNPLLEVEVWSDKAHELWGLRSDEVEGQSFLSLDIGLPVERLREPVRQCLDGSQGGSLLLDGINRRGVAVVQDPREADYPAMPASAIANVAVDHIVPVAEIGPLLDHLLREPRPAMPADCDVLVEKEPDAMGTERKDSGEGDELEKPSALTCPDSGGTLFERPAEPLLHFRCRTGHAYSPDASWSVGQGEDPTVARISRNLRGSTGLTRWWSNPASRER